MVLAMKKAFSKKDFLYNIFGADDGSRTHLSSLGSSHTTDVLHPHVKRKFIADYTFDYTLCGKNCQILFDIFIYSLALVLSENNYLYFSHIVKL